MAITNQAAQGNTGKKTVYKPVPEGDYLVTVNKIEEGLITTGKNAGVGRKVRIGFELVDKLQSSGEEPYTKFIHHQFNYSMPLSSQSEGFSKNQLDRFLKAIGVTNGFSGIGNDVSELENFLGKELIVKVKIEAGTGGYRDRNVVQKWIRR